MYRRLCSTLTEVKDLTGVLAILAEYDFGFEVHIAKGDDGIDLMSFTGTAEPYARRKWLGAEGQPAGAGGEEVGDEGGDDGRPSFGLADEPIDEVLERLKDITYLLWRLAPLLDSPFTVQYHQVSGSDLVQACEWTAWPDKRDVEFTRIQTLMPAEEG